MKKKSGKIKENFGVEKEDLERGYKDGMYRKKEGDMEMPEFETPIGGFCDRPMGWER
jgi:hypothetical protein